ncbi:hypothetical protein MPER_01913, partial [Moniliophthora perniciosa FA553]
MLGTWAVKRFTDAVYILQYFDKLESLRLGELFVLEDNEEELWSRLELETMPTLRHLEVLRLVDVRSPYNMLALLEAGAPFTKLRLLYWHFGGKMLSQLGDRLTRRWYRFCTMLGNLEILELHAEDMDSEGWNLLDL